MFRSLHADRPGFLLGANTRPSLLPEMVLKTGHNRFRSTFTDFHNDSPSSGPRAQNGRLALRVVAFNQEYRWHAVTRLRHLILSRPGPRRRPKRARVGRPHAPADLTECARDGRIALEVYWNLRCRASDSIRLGGSDVFGDDSRRLHAGSLNRVRKSSISLPSVGCLVPSHRSSRRKKGGHDSAPEWAFAPGSTRPRSYGGLPE